MSPDDHLIEIVGHVHGIDYLGGDDATDPVEKLTHVDVGRMVAQILANANDKRIRTVGIADVSAGRVDLTLADGRCFVLDVWEDTDA